MPISQGLDAPRVERAQSNSPETVPAGRQPEVLLVASIDAVGIARLPRLFMEAGFRVSVLASPRLAVLKSRYIAERIVPRPGIDPLVEELGSRLDVEGAYSWIVLCDEIVMRHLANLPDGERFSKCFPMPFAERNVALSNLQFALRADAAGITQPEFQICTGETGGRRSAARIGYPVVFKAEYGMAGSGVRLLRKEADWVLIDIPTDQPFLIQRYIAGQTGATNILFDRGTPVCWFSFGKRHHWPNDFGPSGGGVFVYSAQIDKIVHDLGRVIQFHGLCSIDWVEDIDPERIVLIEFNPRPTPSLYAGPWAGVNFSKGIRAIVDGKRVVQNPSPTPAKTEFLMFPESAYHAIDYRRMRLLLKSLACAPFSNPALLCAILRRMLTHYVRKLPILRSDAARHP